LSSTRVSRLTCCMCIFQVFHMHVASVSCGCCKIRILHICCNGYTCMLQASIPKVSAISNICCPVFIWVLHMFHTYVASVLSGCYIYFHTYVASVSSRCCIHFEMATHVFLSCFRHMLQVSQLFWVYVANVSSICCKSRSGVHMLQWTPSTTATCCSFKACLHARGCEGARAIGMGNHAGTDRDRAVQDMEQAQDTKQCGPPPKAGEGVRFGRPDASPRPDVRALAFPTSCAFRLRSFGRHRKLPLGSPVEGGERGNCSKPSQPRALLGSIAYVRCSSSIWYSHIVCIYMYYTIIIYYMLVY
jgi:hypothetical protein